MQSFHNKVAVITGAASGIGEALARALDREGSSVVLVDVERDALERVAADLKNAGSIQVLDVSDAEAVELMAANVFEQYGHVHLLFNNAGVMGPMAPIWQQEDSDWRWVFSVNVLGVANGVRSFVPRMLEQTDPAHIINTASEAAFASRAFVSVYHASKHAVLALTEGLAQELGFLEKPIRVSALCPGAVTTKVMKADRNRPATYERAGGSNEFGERLARVYDRSLERGLSPEEVAEVALNGIREGRFYLLPHVDVAELPARRADDVSQDRYPELAKGLAQLLRAD